MAAIAVHMDSPPRGIGQIGRFHSAAVYCGLKAAEAGSKQGDLSLIWNDSTVAAAGVFTTNKVAAAPVELCRERLEGLRARAVLVNAGNANCCTGEQGRAAAREATALVAGLLGCPEGEVLMASTGVIGRPMPVDKVRSGIEAIGRLAGAPRGSRAEKAPGEFDVSTAIMTTDTVPKTASAKCSACGVSFSIAGIAKGAGMIAPRMATMLSFMVTDLAVAGEVLRQALRDACEQSFNRVTVDGDTSTNDTLIALADGSAGNKALSRAEGELYEAFAGALASVAGELAKSIARDGEGAEHFVEVSVRGARSDAEAASAARTVAESPLVKTAVAGKDPNWGRILAAVGRAGVEFDPSRATVAISGVEVFRRGEPRPENEAPAGRKLAEHDVEISIDLALGRGAARIWTCDLTHGYIDINAHYHT